MDTATDTAIDKPVSPKRIPQNLRDGAVFAVQVIICSVILRVGFHLANARWSLWAMVSAATALLPGWKDSLASSWRLMAANWIGAAVALAVGLVLGDGSWQFLPALLIVIFVCSAFHLDQSLRSACVAVFIVLLIKQEQFVKTGIQRAIAVTIGCALAVLVEWVTRCVRRCPTTDKKINAPGG
jgi:uncharacterized membrane protein YccC